MSIIITGGGGNNANVDANNNLQITQGYDAIPSAGGNFMTSGECTAAIAASLAANTLLMSMRVAAGSTRSIYVTKFRTIMAAVTVGASALVPGTLGLQRFTAVTPTGGTARTAARLDANTGSISDVTDIRDLNAALTGAPTFGDVLSVSLVPIFVTSGTLAFEWIVEPRRPIKLLGGDGLALRTQVVMPATQTWMYSYFAEWYEK